MPLKHGPIEGVSPKLGWRYRIKFSMPLKHGPIEGGLLTAYAEQIFRFSMPLKHGPIEGSIRWSKTGKCGSFPCP